MTAHYSQGCLILPFLKNKKETGVYVQPTTTKHMGGEPSPMQKAIRSLIEAIETKDETAAEAAFKDCFQCCENEPHSEVDAESSDESEQE